MGGLLSRRYRRKKKKLPIEQIINLIIAVINLIIALLKSIA